MALAGEHGESGIFPIWAQRRFLIELSMASIILQIWSYVQPIFRHEHDKFDSLETHKCAGLWMYQRNSPLDHVFLPTWREKLRLELRTDSHGYIARKCPSLAESVSDDFPDVGALHQSSHHGDCSTFLELTGAFTATGKPVQNIPSPDLPGLDMSDPIESDEDEPI
jgi:hypothetical protein